MNQLVTSAIILARTDYGEADRILTLLTPDYGKLSLLAKGVRRVKSKLAGGIELFSVSDITFIKGRGGVGTLVSTRLVKHYEHIVADLERTMLGYELLKRLNKVTEDQPESEYFDLLRGLFEALDDDEVPLAVVRFWFAAQLLTLGGHMPNLRTEAGGNRLEAGRTYDFDFDRTAFRAAEPGREGRFTADHIKLLRLVFSGGSPKLLSKVAALGTLLPACDELVRHLTVVIPS